jgi:hypothetical protein
MPCAISGAPLDELLQMVNDILGIPCLTRNAEPLSQTGTRESKRASLQGKRR